MAKFCGKCGSKLDEATGLCPKCDAQRGQNKFPISNCGNQQFVAQPVHRGNTSAQKPGEKKNSRNFKARWIFLPLSAVILFCVIVVMLGCFHVIELPFLFDFLPAESYIEENSEQSAEQGYGEDQESTISAAIPPTSVSSAVSEESENVSMSSEIKSDFSSTLDESSVAEPISAVTDSNPNARLDSYLLPQSSQRLLTYQDIVGLSDHDLMLARNEIYARHGRKFKDAEIQTYFNKQDWYQGTVEPENFSETALSEIEKQNVAFLKEHEEEKEPAADPQSTTVITGEYVLPYSSTRYLSESDIKGLSSDQLELARNEIYARHGRKFNDQGLQEYFNSKSWYSGKYSPDEFKESMLSEIEKYNIELIKSHE